MRTTLFFQCDGEAISLPNLQGIVVLNITSYAGGVNFWGSNTATTVSMEQGTGKEKGLTPQGLSERVAGLNGVGSRQRGNRRKTENLY